MGILDLMPSIDKSKMLQKGVLIAGVGGGGAKGQKVSVTPLSKFSQLILPIYSRQGLTASLSTYSLKNVPCYWRRERPFDQLSLLASSPDIADFSNIPDNIFWIFCLAWYQQHRLWVYMLVGTLSELWFLVSIQDFLKYNLTFLKTKT